MEPALRPPLADIGRQGGVVVASVGGPGLIAARARRGLHSCPTCHRPWPVEVVSRRPLTSREVDVMSAWWYLRSVKLAAVLIGVGEQRAKNLLASGRSKSGAASNLELCELHLGQIRSKHDLASHNA